MSLHQFFLRMFEADKAMGRKPYYELSLEDARAQAEVGASLLDPGPQAVMRKNIKIPTRHGSIDGRILSAGNINRGIVIYVHGGGWVTGSLNAFEGLGRHLATRSGCSVLLIDYRLAPDFPFPSALEDVIDAIRWVDHDRLGQQGMENPIIVAGDSAGANLATVAAISLVNEVNIALQVLFYPVADTDFSRRSYQIYSDGFRFTKRDMLWFLENYAPYELWCDPLIAPIKSSYLRESPPVWIALAECDILHDEGRAYARKLRGCGVHVEERVYLGMVHGFIRMMNLVEQANHALNDAAEAIWRITMPINGK